MAAHAARHEGYLKQREETKERRKRDALRRIAPGFEPSSGPLVPVKISSGRPDVVGAQEGSVIGAGMHDRTRSVMDDLVDHLAALDAVSGNSNTSSAPPSAISGSDTAI